MILLREFASVSDAENLAENLRSKGIMTHLSGIDSKNLGGFVTGAVKVGVWVVLEEQENDATSLLSDNNHVVEHALTETEMLSLEKLAATQVAGSVNFALNILVVSVVIIIVSAVAYSVLSST